MASGLLSLRDFSSYSAIGGRRAAGVYGRGRGAGGDVHLGCVVVNARSEYSEAGDGRDASEFAGGSQL